ncbi:hypothetical protein M0638_24945 [Roseomonas sp. NAR14]|uniref:Uncharacterized protein n=1 Tax=Roseomonas acroporae TaxID=2937791 RepID=A0A9X2BWB8_9PROT|nr:hypothetical protein [Roseomonas acroporae]MCK8787618.1 hypothetical protein [Roseomonas acroporae]
MTTPAQALVDGQDVDKAKLRALLSELLNADSALSSRVTATETELGNVAITALPAGAGTRLASPAAGATLLDLLVGAVALNDLLLRLIGNGASTLAFTDAVGRAVFSASQDEMLGGPLLVTRAPGGGARLSTTDLLTALDILTDGIVLPGGARIRQVPDGADLAFAITDAVGRVWFGVGPAGVVTAAP